jgi:hypothetical protein
LKVYKSGKKNEEKKSGPNLRNKKWKIWIEGFNWKKKQKKTYKKTKDKN